MNKNSEVSTILIQRNKGGILKDIEAAMVYLDTEVYHIPGQLVMVRYYTDEQQTNVDTLLAVGVRGVKRDDNMGNEVTNNEPGYGRNHYSIISTAELYIVYDVLNEPVDVSSLIQDQRFLCKVDGVWKIELIDHEGLSRTFIDIPSKPDPYIFRNLADGLRYFYNQKSGELVREDNFITPGMLSEELTVIEESVDPPTISQLNVIRDETYDEPGEEYPYNVYPAGASLTELQFQLYINDYKNEDITDQFQVVLYKDGEVVGEIHRDDKNNYRIDTSIEETSTYEVRATNPKNGYTLSETFTISIVSPIYYGKMRNFSLENITRLKKSWWDGRGILDCPPINLENEITILAIPSNLKQEEFTSIKDTHGLNYIKDYYKNLESIGTTEYIIYQKMDQVTIDNFKQTFGYE